MTEGQTMKATPWTIDRTVNLPFLGTVATALIAAVVWTSSVNSRLDRLEERTQGLPEVSEKLARMDERGEGSKQALQRIERRLDALDHTSRQSE